MIKDIKNKSNEELVKMTSGESCAVGAALQHFDSDANHAQAELTRRLIESNRKLIESINEMSATTLTYSRMLIRLTFIMIALMLLTAIS